MPENHLHIISFTIPLPANYGGVIDVFYQIKTLFEQGIKIHLHCFEYDRKPDVELEKYCESIHYYKRKTGILSHFSLKPFIVKSRNAKELLKNLSNDSYPILFEGLHCCHFINNKYLQNRGLFYRACNIEHEYYFHLFKSEQNWIRKAYFLIESVKLWRFEKHLKYTSKIFAVSQKDVQYLKQKFARKTIEFIPCFHGNQEVKLKTPRGNYVLFHGNLSVPENDFSAKYLINRIFTALEIPLKIAGLNPSKSLVELVGKHKHIELLSSPSQIEMEQLIENAQINLLISFQATGLKLKLLNSIYKGRWVLANPQMLAGSGLDSVCEISKTDAELKEKIIHFFELEYTENLQLLRKKILTSTFSDQSNAQKLVRLIFE